MMNVKKIRRIAITWLLLVSLILPMLPSIDWSVFAAEFKQDDKAYHFVAGDVAVINKDLIDYIDEKIYSGFAKNPTFVIHNGVFSVTVIGDIEVSIVFGTKNNSGGYDGVTIDRTNEQVSGNTIGTATTGSTTLEQLYEAGKTLGWTYNNNNNQYYVPTAPFLITGGAKVTALFLGNTTIKAHLNRRYVTNDNGTYTFGINNNNNNLYCGYAGIQVDGKSSLSITNVTDGTLKVYGGHQYASGTQDPIIFNSTWRPNGQNEYSAPSGADPNACGGGAAIGGGASYNTQNSKPANYTQGTPGEIIINGGTIEAIGGHLSAAIGGGFNGGATTSKIEINGGTIKAIGGRFATAIGDGDSLNKQQSTAVNGYSQNASPSFIQSSQIVINGGTINAYGGAGAAAIGTTDEVSDASKGFGANAVSGMTITITGGRIEAQSGAANEANCAAIGSGNKTNMKDNSITIYSAAVVFARSYSNYAISNKGTESGNANENIPMVNIDPNGFMYLARFNDESSERVLTLYPIYRDTRNNLVMSKVSNNNSGDAHNILNGSTTTANGDFYAREIALEGETTVIRLYKVEWKNGQFEPVLNDNGDKQYLTVKDGDKFSYFYDKSQKLHTFAVPGTYKAVALTIGKGDYIFHIPKGNDTNYANDIYAHFSKALAGTTSAYTVENGTKDNQYCIHLTCKKDKNELILEESPHVKEDAIANAFTDVQLFYYEKGLPNQDPVWIDKLEDIYNQTVLGYTVYLPHGTTEFGMKLYYSAQDVQQLVVQYPGLTAKPESQYAQNSNNEVSYSKPGNSTAKDPLTENPIEGKDLYYQVIDFTIPVSETQNGEQVYDLWVNKIDTVGGAQAFLTYRIRVIVRAEYYINVESVSKEYDGTPVNPNILSIVEGMTSNFKDSHEYNTITLPDGSKQKVVYGNHVSSYKKNGEKVKLVFNTADGIPVTVEYLAVPNETETSISLITTFTYTVGETDVVKRSTVNINMDGTILFTLDASSNSVLMTSSTGNYLIETAKRDEWVEVKADGTLGNVYPSAVNNDCTRRVYWTIYVSHVDANGNKTKVPLLEFTAIEISVETDITNLPNKTNDGQTLYDSEGSALAGAKNDAATALQATGSNANLHEIRYSDSYYCAAEKAKKETFALTVTHAPAAKEGETQFSGSVYGLDDTLITGNIPTFSFSIVDDYLYMYYMFYYYAYKEPSGKTITFTQEQLDQIRYRYYRDVDGDGLIHTENGDYYIGEKGDAPKDAGDYLLVMEYPGEEYEAYTAVAFEIHKRSIEITGVENWLTYLSAEEIQKLQNASQTDHLKRYPLLSAMTDAEKEAFKSTGWKEMFGTVYFSNLVEGDVLELSDHVYAYYNEITISYNASKITLRYDAVYGEESVTDGNSGKTIISGYQKDWLGDKAGPDANGNYTNDNRNYELTGVTNFTSRDTQESLDFSYVHVAGMLAYETEGVIFRKEDDADSIWQKYWPSTSEEYLKWDYSGAKDELGNYITPDILENGIDFESPSNASHQKHVYLKTQNADRASKYSFDVEYGSMEFIYAKAVWNVGAGGEYEYIETDESRWVTNDGVTNKITVINRSDAEIEFSASVSVNSVVAYGVSIGYASTSSVENLSTLTSDYSGELASAATNDGSSSTSKTFYLIVDGEPPKANAKTMVGTISVIVGPKTNTLNN